MRSISKRQLIKLIGIAIIIAALIALLILVRQRQELRRQAAYSPGSARLTLSPDKQTMKVGETVNINVSVNPGATGAKLTGVEIHFSYDPQKLNFSALTIIPSSGLVLLKELNDPTIGRYRAALGVNTTQGTPTFVTTATPVADLKFSAKATGTTAINLLRQDGNFETIVTEVTQDVNVLGGVSPTTINLDIQPQQQTKGTLNIETRLQGISRQTSKNFKIVLLQNTQTIQDKTASITSDTSGVFKYTLTDITPGTYSLLIKEDTRLRRRFDNINITAGSNVIDTKQYPLRAGDFNNNNEITSQDIASFLVQYTKLSVPLTSANAIYDVDASGVITIQDIATVLPNYTQLRVVGD